MAKASPKKSKAAPVAKEKARPVAKAIPAGSGVKALKLDLPPGVLLGAHTSTSGGVSQSVARAQGLGFTAAQIFVKNNKQWFAPPLAEEEVAHFRVARKESGIYFFAHNSYLVNLASQDPEMFATSVRAMTAELERAEALGLPFIVMHPGSHGGAGHDGGSKRR